MEILPKSKSSAPKTAMQDIKTATIEKNKQLADLYSYQTPKLKKDGGFYGHMTVKKAAGKVNCKDHTSH